MSKNFIKIKKYYDKSLWTILMVHNAVGKRTGITEQEFYQITGIQYETYEPEE